MLGTLSPTHGFLSRPAFTGPYWPMTRHVTSRVTSPLHLGSHSLITAHAFDHFIHVPSFQAGPLPRPDSDGPDFISRPPIRLGLLPSRTRKDRVLSGPPCCSSRLMPWTEGPEAPTPPGQPRCVQASWPRSHGICGLASTATSRCRSLRPGCPIDWRQAPRRLRHIAPRRHEPSAGGEGLPQTTPLLSVRGCEWGPTPLSSMNTMSSR